MKAVIKKTIEMSMSEEEAIRLGSEIESIISGANTLMESKISVYAANSAQIISDSVGPESALRQVFDLLKYMTKEDSVSAQ